VRGLTSGAARLRPPLAASSRWRGRGVHAGL